MFTIIIQLRTTSSVQLEPRDYFMELLLSNRHMLVQSVALSMLLSRRQNRHKTQNPREHSLEQYLILELAQYYGKVDVMLLTEFLGVTFDRTIFSWLGGFCSSGMLQAEPGPAGPAENRLRQYMLTAEGDKLLVRLRKQFVEDTVFPHNAAFQGSEFSDTDPVKESLMRQNEALKRY